MDFVGEYTSKTKEAARKAKMAEALQQMALTPQAGTIDAGGYSSVMPDGTVMNNPGYQNVNYGGMLSGLGAAFLGNKAEERASAAEAEAQAAKAQAVRELLGGVGSSSTLTAEQMAAAEAMGIDGSVLKLGMKKEPALGAQLQGRQSRAQLKGMLDMGLVNPTQYAEGIKAIEAEEAAENAQAIAQRAPTEPRSESEIELFNRDPEAFAQYMAAKNAGKDKAGGGATGGRYDPAREAMVLAEAAKELRAVISKSGDEMFGVPQTGAAILRKTGAENPGSLMGNLSEAVGTKFESPANSIMRARAVDTTLEQIAKMAPASDSDVRTLMANRANAFQSKESALAFISLMEKVAARYAGGVPETTVDADGWGIEP